MRTADFDFVLPPKLIAQAPARERDHSRLCVLSRTKGRIEHRRFSDLVSYLRPGDRLILNDSRVLHARLRGNKMAGGGEIEVLVVEENGVNDWWAMLRPGKRVRAGTQISFRNDAGQLSKVTATVLDKSVEGLCRLQFSGTTDLRKELSLLGEIPLPPYITRAAQAEGVNDVERYQTVYAKQAGSVAAPTAGLHFTEPLLSAIQANGVQIGYLTLHVGLGTFAPVKSETVEDHRMHEESFSLSAATAQAIHDTKESGGRIIAVGTTVVRVLESVAANHGGKLAGMEGRTRIFIYPPYRFKVVDALLTNFHLPQSTLLMLVSAFAAPDEVVGRERILSAYAEAIKERYRFFSYGDAMLLL